ncbi:MAG: Grx4 family monothiol glutaredoxin [Bradymonadales bacterium]|nr:MAG: Grx4 family monothiol glutaredoxin [Bradymonadales bacterium]
MAAEPNAKFQEITSDLEKNPVLLYMKGDRVFPQCGFSAQVVEILESLGVSYETRDVLADPELRSALKSFSNWPTFPQLFVERELVGGCDIVTSMAQSGELQDLFRQKALLAGEQLESR